MGGYLNSKRVKSLIQMFLVFGSVVIHYSDNSTKFLGLAGILDDDRDYADSSNLGSGAALSAQADHQVPSSNQGSRFSQFFQRPQPELKLDERRSSIQVK